MHVLTLGWEFPPFFAGGVGIVAEALTRAIVAKGVEVTYLMPVGPDGQIAPGLRIMKTDTRVETLAVPSLLEPYGSARDYASAAARRARHERALYGGDLLEEVERFAREATELVSARHLSFDLIHAHDWTTFPAGLAIRARSGKPLIVHVHITEYDKSGGSGADPIIFEVERAGMRGADRVVAVSELVKRRCIEQYGIDADKIDVVYHGVSVHPGTPTTCKSDGVPTVLFLGRVTRQKGPEVFVRAAHRVLEHLPDVRFVVAGTGDLLPDVITLAASLGIGHRMLFAGFVDRAQVASLFQDADVFVMPSVSEPFGMVPLEAMSHGVPVVLSRLTGAAEVVENVLKFDPADVDDLASKIISVLENRPLWDVLHEQGIRETSRLPWARSAARMLEVYDGVTGRREERTP